MNLHDLSQLYWLRREIKLDEERLRELESRAYNAPGSGAAGGGRQPESSRTERYALELAAIHATVAAKQAQCVAERQRLETYIAGIDDSLTRQIYTLRFVDGLTWEQVAARIGGGNTADSVRMACYRYLRAHG